eukprot:TRINITY_DN6711_c0_g1_i1.p1 TRINITY_DN6711_c0_g1~~TRINITY_DN6711_c0_g1_i1.p1  ORF type:complete len:790 (-),score=143.71 TRINITY_DN6711_c0_g1_i1:20-2389(-)
MGGTIIPFDPNDPLPRLLGLIEDAEPTLLVVKDEKTLAQIKLCLKDKIAIVCGQDLEANHFEGMEVIDERLEELRGEDLSHIFFTSGSTGQPKGCLCHHEALANYAQAKASEHHFTCDSICFVASSHVFDPSLGDFVSTWACGGTLALAPRSLILSHLGDLLHLTHASHLLTSPSLLATLSDWSPTRLPHLAVVALGGEQMPLDLLLKWQPHLRLINTYGVTECCVYQTAATLRDSQDPDALSSVRCIGEPLPANLVLLFDSEGHQISPDSTQHGEIWIGGAQVGRGYLNRPELTRAAFVDHPQHGRMFKTGDIAHYGSGGLYLLGRRDTQVKIRGQRVELGEIDHVIHQAKLLLHDQGLLCTLLHHTSQLVAFHQSTLYPPLSNKQEALALYLRWKCSLMLPAHMIPGRYVAVPSLAMTPTGKINRKELSQSTLPPLSHVQLEEQDLDEDTLWWRDLVLQHWKVALGLPHLQPSSSLNFLELGGDSLLALTICRSLHDAINHQSPQPHLNDMHLAETLGALAPAELMKRPYLHAFALHLRTTFARGEHSPEPDSQDPSQEDIHLLLVKAVTSGAHEILEYVLNEPSSLLQVKKEALSRHSSLLHMACSAGQLSIVQLLIAKGASVNGLTPGRVTPLHLAAQKGPASVIHALLENNALQCRDDNLQVPLHYAARAGAPGAIFDALLAKPSSKGKSKVPPGVNEQDKWRRTPLHWAVLNGHQTAVEKLLSYGADSRMKDGNDESALDIAERRARCSAQDRPSLTGASLFGNLAKLLGGSGTTKHLRAKGL